MSDDSEEACLVNPRSPSVTGSLIQYGTQLNTNMQEGVDFSNTLNASNAGNRNSGRSNVDASSNHDVRDNQTVSTERGSQSHESEFGELIDYSDEILLSQFHADAIKQTSCGKFQILAAIIIGLGFAGHSIQIYAVYYILPSAEVEYCILEHEKNWLRCITLLGLGCGALLWGGLAGRTGRRKTLISCLAVSSVFSMVAAFMPTYGPFMMARFCAAAGMGGVLPAGACYICEISPANGRSRLLSILGFVGVTGAIFASGVALLSVPQTGQEVMLENKEHFSAWHRYLLIISLPTIMSILGLFWLPESPRWLLDNGREVDALSIYQNIYKTNRQRGGYTLTELELPGARTQRHHIPSSVLAGMRYSINMFFNSFLHLFRKNHLKTSSLLIVSWFAAIFVHHGLSLYITAHSKAVEQSRYNEETIIKSHETYANVVFSDNMENIIFSQSSFMNCTFRRVFLSHINFDNCSFLDVEFANVKTSKTSFTNCTLESVKLIDTDLTDRHFINCTKNNTEITRLTRNCDREFEYNIFIESLWRSNLGAMIPSLISLAVIGEVINLFGRSRISTVCFSFATMLICAFGFMYIDDHIIWTGGTAQAFILAGLAALTILTIETYTTSLRCSALGLCVCSAHIGALLSFPIYSALPCDASNFAAGLSTISMIIPLLSSAAIKDPCMLL